MNPSILRRLGRPYIIIRDAADMLRPCRESGLVQWRILVGGNLGGEAGSPATVICNDLHPQPIDRLLLFLLHDLVGTAAFGVLFSTRRLFQRGESGGVYFGRDQAFCAR